MGNTRSGVRHFLSIRLDGISRALLVAAALLLLLVYLFPLWNMTMFAPQYPHGLRLDIYASYLSSGDGGQDLREINVLNHYIGMRDIAAADFTEFRWIPFVIGALVLLFLGAAAWRTVGGLVAVLGLTAAVGIISLYSFATRLYTYGHNLSPGAPVKVDPFMPPMFGYRQLANFEVYSYPGPASYAMAAATLLLIVALGRVWWREGRHGHGHAGALAHA